MGTEELESSGINAPFMRRGCFSGYRSCKSAVCPHYPVPAHISLFLNHLCPDFSPPSTFQPSLPWLFQLGSLSRAAALRPSGSTDELSSAAALTPRQPPADTGNKRGETCLGPFIPDAERVLLFSYDPSQEQQKRQSLCNVGDIRCLNFLRFRQTFRHGQKIPLMAGEDPPKFYCLLQSTEDFQ